jgi:uncharacterized protein YxeA
MKEILFWFYHVFVIVIAALLIAYSTYARNEVSNIETLDQYQRAMETLDFWGKGKPDAIQVT